MLQNFPARVALSLSLSRESGSVDWSVIYKKKKAKPKGEKTTIVTTTKKIVDN